MKSWSASLTWMIPLVVIVGLVSVGSALYWSLLSESHKSQLQLAQQRNELRAKQLNEAVTQQLDATLRGVDLALKHLRAVYVHDPKGIERAIQDVVTSYPAGMLQMAIVIDGDGRLVNSSNHPGFNAAATYFGDRKYFDIHANAQDDELFVSEPIVGRISGLTIVQVTRGIWVDKQFRGVIAIPLRPDYLSKHLLSLRVDASDILAIVRPDGRLIARSHNLDEALKTQLPPDRPFLKGRAGERGLFRSTSTFDKVPVLFSWQRLAQWPLISVAAVDENAEMAPLHAAQALERQHTLVTFAVVLAFSLGVAVLMMRIQRQKNQLARSEARHRALFERAKIPALLIRPQDGAIVDANDAAVTYYGHPKSRLLTLSTSDLNVLSLPEIRDEMTIGNNGNGETLVFSHRLASGEIRKVEVHCGPIEIEGRELLYSFVHDVTERQQLEAARDEALERLQKIASRLPGVVYQYLMRPDGSSCFPFVSAAITEMYGVSPEEVRLDATKVLAVLHPEDHDEVVTSIQEAARTLVPWHQSFRVRHVGGTIRWFMGSAVPQRLDDGSTLWHGFSTDITERKLTQLALDTVLAEQRTILNSKIAGIVKLKDRKFVWMNAAFATMMGYTIDELIGQSTRVLYLDGEAHEAFAQEAYPALEAGLIYQTEIQYRHKDGVVGWYEINGEFLDLKGTESIWSFVDITERKQVREHMEALIVEQRALLNNELVGIVTVCDRHIVWANPAFEKMLGYESGELAGMPTSQNYLNEADYRAFGEAAYPVLESGAIFRSQVQGSSRFSWKHRHKSRTPACAAGQLQHSCCRRLR